MNKFIGLVLLVSPKLALAGGGFTFLKSAEEALHIPEHTITLVVLSICFLLAGILYRSITSTVPNKLIPDSGISLRNIIEALSQYIYGLCSKIMGEESTKKYFSYIIFVFLFILINNMIGLIPGFASPNQNLNTTLALGLFTFFYFNIQGMRAVGVVNYWKHFMGPIPLLGILIFPIELISISVRPLSLALRLRGNMDGDHLILGIFSNLVPYIVPIPFYGMGLFVSFLQAFVFTMLTMIYISMATAHHDHGEHEHH